MPKDYEIRRPREDEKDDLYQLFYECFPNVVDFFKVIYNDNRPIMDYIYGYEPRVMIMDGRIIANVSLVRYKIYLGGEVVPIGGIGGVVTLPEYQRRGYSKILLEERLRNMREEGTYISVLLSDLPWAYQSVGFKVVPQGYQNIDLSDQKKCKLDSNVSVVDDLESARSTMELYNETAPAINGAIKRSPEYWEDYYFKGHTGFVDSHDKYLLYKEGSELFGYARIHSEDTPGQMLLGEIVAKDWNTEILKKLTESSVKAVLDQGCNQMNLGVQDNHPLKKLAVEMGLNPTTEIPEGIREMGMINVLKDVLGQDKYLKSLNWCYYEKF